MIRDSISYFKRIPIVEQLTHCRTCPLHVALRRGLGLFLFPDQHTANRRVFLCSLRSSAEAHFEHQLEKLSVVTVPTTGNSLSGSGGHLNRPSAFPCRLPSLDWFLKSNSPRFSNHRATCLVDSSATAVQYGPFFCDKRPPVKVMSEMLRVVVHQGQHLALGCRVVPL